MAGLAIAAPVGPVNVLCASRTLSKGRVCGLVSGLGAATADALYGAIAGFSISLVIDFLRREESPIRIAGGVLLVAIGVVYLRKPARPFEAGCGENTGHSDYTSTLLLTLTNPTTVLSFLAVLAALGMGDHRAWWLSFVLVGGIFCGSMLWWITLVVIVNHLREHFDTRAISRMNRVAGLAIGGFGLFSFVYGLAGMR